jgi:hypothetical protein
MTPEQERALRANLASLNDIITEVVQALADHGWSDPEFAGVVRRQLQQHSHELGYEHQGVAGHPDASKWGGGYEAHGAHRQQDTCQHDGQRCPDDYDCRHHCPASACYRVHHVKPVPGTYPGNRWPGSIRLAYTDGGVL